MNDKRDGTCGKEKNVPVQEQKETDNRIYGEETSSERTRRRKGTRDTRAKVGNKQR